MLTATDARKGLVKVYWDDVRERIASIDPHIVRLIDDLSPDQNYPLFLAYYRYGDFTGDTQSILLPTTSGDLYRLIDPGAPSDVKKHLGYGASSAPLSMVLDKNLEWFVDIKDMPFAVPWSIYKPGDFFPVARIMNKQSNRRYTSNGLLSTVSGARSAFMLPSIGCVTNHVNLQRDFNIQDPAAKSLNEHWNIFKKIANSPLINCDWRSCLLLFSEQWIQSLHNDEAWNNLKIYMQNLSWSRFEYERNHVYFDLAYSSIMNKRNLKPNPYLVDVTKHIFSIALGAGIGYAPAINDESMPINIIKNAFIESYGMKKYIPTIMQPCKFTFESDVNPIYYSLQHPTTYSLAPKSRRLTSTLSEMRELEHITNIFLDELSSDDFMCSDTILHQISKSTEFNFYHNDKDRHNVIKLSDLLFTEDSRFSHGESNSNATFAKDAKFLRGCIRIRTT